MVVTEEGNICLFIKSYVRTLRENIPRRKQEAIRKNFFTPVTKHLKDNKQKSFVLRENLSVPGSSQFSLSFASREFVRILEQIMTADKYPCAYFRAK